MFKKLKLLWQTIRRLSGDDAYEQYLLHFSHHQKEHPHTELLSQEEFFNQWQDKKWKGVKRCC